MHRLMLMSQMKSDMPSKISYSVPFGTTKKTKLREKVFRYQDYDKGGICMTDVNIMIKALAWISRLLNPGSHNWKSIPDYFFKN